MTETLNFIFFIGFMIFITILIKNSYDIKLDLQDIVGPNKVENFEDMKTNNFEYKPLKSNTISLRKDKEYRGWNKYYRDNYMKGTVKSPDNFDGTIFRNYLDNMKYFHN